MEGWRHLLEWVGEGEEVGNIAEEGVLVVGGRMGVVGTGVEGQREELVFTMVAGWGMGVFRRENGEGAREFQRVEVGMEGEGGGGSKNMASGMKSRVESQRSRYHRFLPIGRSRYT